MAVLVASTTPLLLTPSHSYHQPRDYSSPHHTTFEPFPNHHQQQYPQQQHDDNTIQQQMWYPTHNIYLPCVNEDDEDDDIELNDTPTTSFLPRQPFGINYSNARIYPTIYTNPSTTTNNGQIPQSPLIKPFKSKNVEHFTNNDTTLFDENGDFIPYNTYNLSTPSSHFNTGFNNNEQQEQQPLASTLTASTLAPTLSMNNAQFNLNTSFNTPFTHTTPMTSTINEHHDSFNPTQQQFAPNHPSFGTSSHINEQHQQFTPVQHQQCDEQQQPTTTFLTPPTVEQTFSHLPPFQQQHQPQLFNHIHDNQQQKPQPQVDSIEFNSPSMSFQQQQQFYQNQQQYVPALNQDMNYTNHSPSPTVNPIITPTIAVDKYHLHPSSLRGAAPPAVPQPIQHHKGINNDVINGIHEKLIPKYTIKHPSNEIDLEDDDNNDCGEVSPKITRSSRHSRQNSKQLDLQQMNNEYDNVIIPTLQTSPLQQHQEQLHIDENEQISNTYITTTTIAKTTGRYNKKENNIDKRPTRSTATTSSIKKRNEASDIDDVWDEKQKYREKNRISAQRSRQKKRDIQSQQQLEYNLCEAENNKLRLKITQLESQLKFFQDFYNAQQQQSQQQQQQPQQPQQYNSQPQQQYQNYQQYH